jgi:hypothetical protein
VKVKSARTRCSEFGQFRVQTGCKRAVASHNRTAAFRGNADHHNRNKQRFAGELSISYHAGHIARECFFRVGLLFS